MDIQKLNPWNWFKHEDNGANKAAQIPVQRKSAYTAPSIWQQNQHPVMHIHQQIDRLFDDIFNTFGLPSSHTVSAQPAWSGAGLANAYRPHVNVSGDNKQYEITLEVPGLTEDDLSIEVKGDMLVITGEKEEKNEQTDKQFYRVERSYGVFQRTLSLPADTMSEDIHAQLKDGVLTLAIPRSPVDQAGVKRIAISSQ